MYNNVFIYVLVVPELTINYFTSVVSGQETEINIYVQKLNLVVWKPQLQDNTYLLHNTGKKKYFKILQQPDFTRLSFKLKL